MRKIMIVLFLILAVSIVPTLAQDDEIVHLRVAHFSVDAGPVDVYIDGEIALENVAFPDVSDWVELPAGVYSVAVTPTGTSVNDAVLGPTDLSLTAGEWLTVAAIGEAVRNTLDIQVITEDYSSMPDGITRISVFNAIPDGAPLNVFANETELVHLLGYPGFFGPESDGFYSADVIAQAYDVSAEFDGGDSVFELEGLTLGQGRNYFFAAVGLAADPLYVMVVTDPSSMMMDETGGEMDEMDLGDGTLHARVAHFSPGAPEVDIYINGALSDMQGMSFPSITGWTELDAGVYDIAIAPAETSIDEAVFRGDVPLATDTWVTIAAIGQLDNDTFDVQVIVEDYSPLDMGLARVSVFHAIPDAPPVDAFYDGELLVRTLGYPGYISADSDGYASIDILADPTTFTVELDGTEIVNTGEIVMAPGKHYFIAVVGLADNPLYILEITEAE